jgi:mono/diheme cytochrome c family protein
LKKSILLLFLYGTSVLLWGAISNTTAAKEPVPFQPGLQKSIAAGKKVYKKYCISCHQADGGGVPNLNPPLIQAPYVLGDKEKLIGILIKGLNENIEIEDQVFTNPMPAWKILKDQEIADVLTYIRNSFGNKASAVTVAEVKLTRSRIR